MHYENGQNWYMFQCLFYEIFSKKEKYINVVCISNDSFLNGNPRRIFS